MDIPPHLDDSHRLHAAANGEPRSFKRAKSASQTVSLPESSVTDGVRLPDMGRIERTKLIASKMNPRKPIAE